MIGAHLTFTVPGTPIPKGRPRIGGGHAFTPRRTKDFESRVMVYALQARQRVVGRWPLGARFRVEVRIYRWDDKGDVDNIGKSALDGCNGVLWSDDAQVDELHLYRVRADDGHGERLVVEVAPC